MRRTYLSSLLSICADKHLEVFYADRDMIAEQKRLAREHFNKPALSPRTDFQQWAADHGYMLRTGWYWWSCSPGCLPDGPAMGPYRSPTAAAESALDY